jgi:hypothetical protein
VNAPGFPDDLANVEDFARAAGIDPDNVPPIHTHYNPQTGQMATASWPCSQCTALGRTEPLRFGRDFPDCGGMGPVTAVPPARLDAYLASFGLPLRAPAAPPGTGDRQAQRKARGKAQRKARRRR